MAQKKRGLGRGLGALIGASTEPSPEASISESVSAPNSASETTQNQDTEAVETEAAAESATGAGTATDTESNATPALTSRPAARGADMFFNGEPAASTSAKRKAMDLADGWARDAQAAKKKSGGISTAKATASKVTASKAASNKVATGESNPVKTTNTSNVDPKVPQSTEPNISSNSTEIDLVPVPGADFAELEIAKIRENPRNPRTVFDEEELNELAYSLREVGVLQPIVVRPVKGPDSSEFPYELVMGERRWRAAKLAGLKAIPAIIRHTTDDDLLRDALLENLHRSQLNPLEEAAAYGQLLEDFGCTQDELASRIGRSRPQISNTLRLLKLPALVQRRLAAGSISAGHARALLALEDAQLQEELAQRIVNEGLSVRAVERLIANGVESASSVRAVTRRTSYNPRVVDLTSKLATKFETPVKIDVGKRKGKITLEFTNLDDLERLIEQLGLEAE